MSKIARLPGNSRGPLRGSSPKGSFKVGPDPRRYSHDEERRRARMTIEQLAREYTEEALQTMVDLMGSDNPKMKLEAATQLLDRAHGKAVDRVQIAQVGQAQGSLKDADMATLMGVLESRIGSDMGQGMGEAPPLLGDYTELNGSHNRQGDDHD